MMFSWGASAARRAIERSEELASQGSWDEAIAVLTDANDSRKRTELEKNLLQLRLDAFRAIPPKSTIADWPAPTPDKFPNVRGIPEIQPSELDAETVSSALQHHGSLLVRGLFNTRTTKKIRNAIEAAFQSAESSEQSGAFQAHRPPWYIPFKSGDEHDFGGLHRSFVREGSGVLAVDSPRALFMYLEALRGIGFDKLLRDYFGEHPALSAKKTTLRRTPPGSVAGWHQDGSFLGAETRSLNIWTAFTPCGVDSPGLDIFAERFDDLVEMGGDEIFDWSVSNDTAHKLDKNNIQRPAFEEGDAILFDQLTLHRTGVDPSMDKTRYAIEMWFFAPSGYPMDQIPLYF